MDGITEFNFTPAIEYTDRHGLFVAVIGDTNSGKSFSGLRLATGIAKAQGKRVAAIDTEGGRLLHLKKHFDFDIGMMRPPHRPHRYLLAAQRAEAKGYGALLIDSYSMEWRGEGGKLDWTREIEDAYVDKKREEAEAAGQNFNEYAARNIGRTLGLNEPGQGQRRMELGFLQLRMPIIFSIRGSDTYDPKEKKAVFKAQCRQGFLFDVTCSFRLAQNAKGIIDLTDAKTFKMEGDHAAIFKHGEQLSERHGELVNAWATNAPLPEKEDKAAVVANNLIDLATDSETEDALLNCHAGETQAKQMEWLKAKRPELHKKVKDAVSSKLAELQRAASQSSASLPTTSHGPDGDADGGQQAVDSPAASVGGDSKPEPTDRPVGQEARSWELPAGIVGQDAKMAAIRKQFGREAETPDEVDAIAAHHAEFIGKLGTKRAAFEREIRERRIALGGPL